MDQTNQFPSCGAYFFRVNSSSSGLIEQGQFDVACQQQSNFRDMTVQAVDSFPILNNQSEIFQNGSELFNLFNQYPLACSSSEINYDLPDFTPEELGACRTLGANEEEKGLNFEIFRIWLQQKLVLIFALLTQFQM